MVAGTAFLTSAAAPSEMLWHGRIRHYWCRYRHESVVQRAGQTACGTGVTNRVHFHSQRRRRHVAEEKCDSRPVSARVWIAGGVCRDG